MNNKLKILTSWQEISFLSDLSILVGMLFSPTDLVESSEDILRAISSLSLGLEKKLFFELYFAERMKSVCVIIFYLL